jgi:hypothetical protein
MDVLPTPEGGGFRRKGGFCFLADGLRWEALGLLDKRLNSPCVPGRVPNQRKITAGLVFVKPDSDSFSVQTFTQPTAAKFSFPTTAEIIPETQVVASYPQRCSTELSATSGKVQRAAREAQEFTGMNFDRSARSPRFSFATGWQATSTVCRRAGSRPCPCLPEW